MTDEFLFEATVPVLRYFLGRISEILDLVDNDRLLQHTLAPGGFACGDHLGLAQGFSLRAVCPLIADKQPDLEVSGATVSDLKTSQQVVSGYLDKVTPGEFAGASSRSIEHVAGEAHIRQSATDYVLIFAMPNFYFHLTMAYASLRAQGVDIGKGHFDGIHKYRPGFRIEDFD